MTPGNEIPVKSRGGFPDTEGNPKPEGRGLSTTLAKNLFPLIAKRIDSFPTLPLTLVRLFEAVERGEGSTGEVAQIVEADPALTAKVLKVINSPFYGLRFKISTLSHAIAMLGLSALKSLAAGISPFAHGDEAEGALDKCLYWQHSLAVAAAARAIARQIEYDLPEEAWIGGLLHDYGKVVLDLYAPDAFASCVAAHETQGGSIVELERKFLGIDHAQVGALVAEKWNLPKILKDAIQFHHEPEERMKSFPRKHRELVSIVSAADRLCWAYGLGSSGSGRMPADCLGLADGRTLSPEQIDRVLVAIHEEFEQVAGRLGISYREGDDFLTCLKAENQRAIRAFTPVGASTSPSERLGAVAEVIRRARRFQNVEDMIEGALNSIQKGLGLDRVLFLQVDLDEERLQGKYLFDDTRLQVDVHDISLPLNPDGLLGTALRDGTAERLDNWATDGDLLRFLGVVEVAAAPVIVNQQPIGVLCGDYFFRNHEIGEDEVSLLAFIALGLGLSIENLVLSRQAGKLRSLAAKDELTGINNRRNLMKLLQKEIERAQRYGSPLSAVMVDIDHFKTFNDNYGHQAGDTVLMEVAQRVVAASREIDVIGRYGGEEFLVVLPETHVDQAIVYAERLRSNVEHFGRERQKTFPKCTLTISVGVTALLRDRDDLEQLIHRVDHALYAAKERGRNRVCVD